ncbi:MAG: o-succinylbenzoate synthase [Opitutus sp.]
MRLRFQFRRYRLPFRVVVRTAHGPWGAREGVMVRLENESGRAGVGEAAPIPWFGTESVDEIESACRELSEWVEADSLADLPERLGCLRQAVADALAKMTVEPSESPGLARVPDLAVAALLPAGRAALAQISAKAEMGFRVFKWKVGVGDFDTELGELDDICGALPEGATLRLDANGAWDVRRAARWLERCADRPVEFLEQPIAADARGAQDMLLGLAGDFPTPIALDESVVCDGDVERWLGAGWSGVFVLKPSLLGDPAKTIERLLAAKAPVVFSSALETAVGAQVALKFAFAWKGERRALGFGVWPLFADARFDGPYTTPFLSQAEVERIDPEVLWNALS